MIDARRADTREVPDTLGNSGGDPCWSCSLPIIVTLTDRSCTVAAMGSSSGHFSVPIAVAVRAWWFGLGWVHGA
jgi:hypothetical protein